MMNTVEKKKKKKSLSKWMLVIVPVVIMLLFLAFLYQDQLLSRLKTEKGSTEYSGTDSVDNGKNAADGIISESDEQLCHIVERNTNELFSVMIQPENDEAYTLAYIDGQMYLDGDTDAPVKESICHELMTYATEIVPSEVIANLSSPGSSITAEVYGLDSPSYVAEITYIDGERITLFFGKDVEMDGMLWYYMKTDRSDYVYLVPSDFYDAFSYKKIALHPVEQLKLDPTLIDIIDVSGSNDFMLQYTKGNWEVIRPAVYPADYTVVDKLLNRISNMRFYAFVGEKDQLALSDYGLSEPSLSIRFTMADTIVKGYDSDNVYTEVEVPGETHQLLIGKEYNAATYYCMYDDIVYIGTDFSIGFWNDVDPFDFMLLNPVNIPTYKLISISVHTKDTDTEYSFMLSDAGNAGSDSQDDSDTVYDLIVYKDNQQIDSNSFLSWYGQLTGLTVSGRLQNNIPESELSPDISLLIKTEDFTRKIDLVKTDPLNYALYINGVSLYQINISKIETLTEMP